MNFLRVLIYFFTVLILLALLFRVYVLIWALCVFLHKKKAPQTAIFGIVFGAGLEKDSSPSKVLEERLDAAVILYKTNQIEKIILSGDNRNIYYNEPLAMKFSLTEKGIPVEIITLDPDGQRSLRTCLNANKHIGNDSAFLITQPFHLARVIWIAHQIGMNASGYPAQHQTHHPLDVLWWHVREIPATARAGLDVLVWKINTVRIRANSIKK